MASAAPAASDSKSDVDVSQFVIKTSMSVAQLKCSEAFDGLTDQEKAYAHHVAAASWEGSKICLLQCSPEAPALFSLFQRVFGAQSPKEFAAAAVAAGVSDIHVKAIIVYIAAFYGNMGNYKSFGDTKFIPGAPASAFEAALGASAAAKADKAAVDGLWKQVAGPLYDLAPRRRQFGLETGLSAYYSADITKKEIELVQRFMESAHLSPYNTRLFKTGDHAFELRMASAKTGPYPGYEDPVTFEGAQISVVLGDYSPLMARVAAQLNAAKVHAANDHQRKMMDKYVDSFTGGDINDHMDASRHWVQDKGPNVESYIGFIESYRDPMGVRGEWEGFVAVVNKKMSAKFAELVGKAEALLPLLPWDKEFEKDTFLRPDFTSLEVVAFGSSGIPAGINIPNYDTIRQGEGFKNVSLGNVLSARDFKERISFLSDADQAIFRSHVVPSFEVQVGLHELLGHGSGKLFTKDASGAANFPDGLVNPETGKPIASWYNAGQTWDTVFSSMASTMEECRAECVGIFLCVNKEVLKIFGHEGADGDDIVYANWLSMARAGLLALMFYSPSTKTWGQAHMQARYTILNVMREAGIVKLVNTDKVDAAAVDKAKELLAAKAAAAEAGAGGAGAGAGAADDAPAAKDDGAAELGVCVQLDRSKIATDGVKAVGDFLRKLQVFKATADFEGAKAMYNHYCAVPDELLPVRDLIMANRKPRPQFVQPVTSISSGGKVELKTFDASVEGLIESFAARFPATDSELDALFTADAIYHAAL